MVLGLAYMFSAVALCRSAPVGTRAFLYIHIQIYKHALYICVYMYVYTRIYIYMYIHLFIYLHTWILTYVYSGCEFGADGVKLEHLELGACAGRGCETRAACGAGGRQS